MDLALDVAAELAAGPTEDWRARAVIDLLASAGPAPAGGRPTLMDQMRQRAEETQHDLDKAHLLLCDDGWRSTESARIMPDVPGDDPLGEDRWRETAEFDVVSSELDGRHAEVEALLTPGRTSHRYSSPHLPVLVGIVGEMHAYRYLRSQFGSGVVTPAAWVSENGLKVLPQAGGEKRDASDRHGFDFRFASDGITWHFEVKATTEDDTSFSLPPSEIRAATRLANSRRDHWRILRIRSALSDTPEIDLLPNPFEMGFSDLFRLSSGGMTVRYALDDAAT